ncbi:MAG TPA: hypothetical protein VHX62_01420 [Solirubrobacteraceae bacterium]|jgi:hypothetical protein|nr:hypothetical protein [Solirubrobacteraceae bacterium]
MGLLDEAIREHLDLKRRRGADPSEVERAEREALGPVRRNRDPADVTEPEDGAAAEGGFAYDQADDQDWSREPGVESADGPYEPLHDEPPHEELHDHVEPADAGPAPSAAPAPSDDPFEDEPRDWSAAGEGELEEEPFPTAEPSPRRLGDAGPETVEFDVENAMAAEGDGEGEDDDVLEETPEFLQDTPDHDRLWFEQRPPRDFDFDG